MKNVAAYSSKHTCWNFEPSVSSLDSRYKSGIVQDTYSRNMLWLHPILGRSDIYMLPWLYVHGLLYSFVFLCVKSSSVTKSVCNNKFYAISGMGYTRTLLLQLFSCPWRLHIRYDLCIRDKPDTGDEVRRLHFLECRWMNCSVFFLC